VYCESGIVVGQALASRIRTTTIGIRIRMSAPTYAGKFYAVQTLPTWQKITL
jgi:hypothetical protein